MEFISIQEAEKKVGEKVSLRGWAYRVRGSNEFVFIILRDYSGIIQCVVERAKVAESVWKEAEKVTVESSLQLSGKIAKEPRAPTGYELKVEDLKLIHKAERFPITKDKSEEFLLDIRHLWLRSRYMTNILKVRSTVFGAIHEYFRKKGFFEFHSPIFTPVACEGGATLFKCDYFGKPIYLSQSWQLYAEAGIFSLEKIYCIAPSFRAEKSKTSRHLTEYWHAETEVAWMRFDEMLDLAEGLVKSVLGKVLKENEKELNELKRDVKLLKNVVEKPFARITYDEALKLLKEKANYPVPWGKDLRTIEERKLTELFDVPVFVTHYPKDIKAFYMKEWDKDPRYVLATDLLAPEGYGEVIGGSERETDVEKLKKRLIAQGEKPELYEWYLDTRRYGSVPHSGFGLGVERLISWICKLKHIRDAIPFPRTMVRWRP